MVECDVCKEWFHQGCITVPEYVWNTPSTPCMDMARINNGPHAIHEPNLVKCILKELAFLDLKGTCLFRFVFCVRSSLF